MGTLFTKCFYRTQNKRNRTFAHELDDSAQIVRAARKHTIFGQETQIKLVEPVFRGRVKNGANFVQVHARGISKAYIANISLVLLK